MLLRYSILIHARPDQVWKVLTELQRFPEWLPKCTGVWTEDEAPLSEGARFKLERRWKQDTRVSDVTITRYHPGECLCWSENMQTKTGPSIVREQFQLRPKATRCRIQHHVDLSEAGIPLWAQVFISLIHLFGSPAGKKGLMRLKELIEQPS